MAKKEKLFSRVLRGFAPDEVIAYIDELGSSHKKIILEKDSEITKLAEQLEKAKETDAKLSKANDELDICRKESMSKDEEIARLTLDTENQRQAIASQGDKISELESELAGVKAELEALQIKNTALENNSKEYESMLVDVDSILTGARRQAEALVIQAQEQAKVIVNDAQKQADGVINNAEIDAKEKAKSIITQADEKLSENLKKVKYLYRRKDELAELFKEHKAKVDSFFASISFGDQEKK